MKGEGENFRFLVGSSFPREEGQGVGGIPKVASLGKSPTKLVGISSFGSQAKKEKKKRKPEGVLVFLLPAVDSEPTSAGVRALSHLCLFLFF